MRATGDYATFQGTEYAVAARGTGSDGRRYVGLVLDDSGGSGFDRVVRQAGPRRTLGFTTTARLDRYERVTTTGVFDGEAVTLHGTEGEVPCFHSRSPHWAEAHGWTGSQHDGGWSGHAPLEAISDLRETVVDLFRPEDHLALIIDAHRDLPGAGFAPPATPEDLAAYRAAFGEDFPAGLAELYRVIGGGPFFDMTLLGVGRIIAARRMWDGIVADSTPDDGYDDDIVSLSPGAVSAAYWKPGWVQFTEDGGGNGFAVDLAPEPAGTPGQVINVGSDDDHRRLYAPSVASLLAALATLIRSGRATTTGGRWTFTHPGHRDPTLLTALAP
ncbi:MAG TPA: SMI1/KNR4 family protein [Pseudonocardiaceae bacterium]